MMMRGGETRSSVSAEPTMCLFLLSYSRDACVRYEIAVIRGGFQAHMRATYTASSATDVNGRLIREVHKYAVEREIPFCADISLSLSAFPMGWEMDAAEGQIVRVY